MRKITNIFTILFCLVGLQSCNTNPDGTYSWQPAHMNLTPPEGPEMYQKGWSEGCESGSNAYTNQFYKSIKAFKYKFDPKLRNEKMYYQIWKDAFFYCAVYWERTNTPYL